MAKRQMEAPVHHYAFGVAVAQNGGQNEYPVWSVEGAANMTLRIYSLHEEDEAIERIATHAEHAWMNGWLEWSHAQQYAMTACEDCKEIVVIK